MEFWNSLLTEKSWNILQELKKENFRFIVIGGLAMYLWTKQHKSKDIDIILPAIKDLEFLKRKYTFVKNERLKKYEIKMDDIDIDIYLPYYSKLGLPLEVVAQKTAKIEGFEVVNLEVLLILKQAAEAERGESMKGLKDRIDIMTLLCFAGIDFLKYRELLEKYNLRDYRHRLKRIVLSFREMKYLNLNVKDYARIKKELLKKI